MWCPPLRIVAVNTQTEESKVVFDQVVQPWRFVKPCRRHHLRMDPKTNYEPVLGNILNTAEKMPRIPDDLPVGGVDSSVSVHLMIYRTFADALSNLRKVKENRLTEDGAIDYEKLKRKYAPWHRGHILASAGFVLDCSKI